MLAIGNDGVFFGNARKGTAQQTENGIGTGGGTVETAKSTGRLGMPVDRGIDAGNGRDELSAQHAELISTYDRSGRMSSLEVMIDEDEGGGGGGEGGGGWGGGGGDVGGGGGGGVDPGGADPIPVVVVPGTPDPTPDPIPVVVIPGTPDPTPTIPVVIIPGTRDPEVPTTPPEPPVVQPPEPPIPIVVIKGQRPVTRYVNFMNQHAQPTYTGFCGRYVKNGLAVAGFDTSGNYVHAKDFGQLLLNNGFRVVPKANYVPKAGDTVVFAAVPGHPSGHVEMYNGSRWVSDTIQPNFLPNSVDYANGAYEIYRMPVYNPRADDGNY